MWPSRQGIDMLHINMRKITYSQFQKACGLGLSIFSIFYFFTPLALCARRPIQASATQPKTTIFFFFQFGEMGPVPSDSSRPRPPPTPCSTGHRRPSPDLVICLIGLQTRVLESAACRTVQAVRRGILRRRVENLAKLARPNPQAFGGYKIY